VHKHPQEELAAVRGIGLPDSADTGESLLAAKKSLYVLVKKQPSARHRLSGTRPRSRRCRCQGVLEAARPRDEGQDGNGLG
jgi:hypothetical protein